MFTSWEGVFTSRCDFKQDQAHIPV